jgi:hypothetical protein
MGMRIRLSVLATLLASVLAAGALAGCGEAGDGTAQPGENVSSSGSPALPPSGRVDPPSASPPKQSTAEQTLTGRPEEGVESGCLVMRSGDTLYLLLGGDRQMLLSGRPVVVRGQPNPGLMTTCQQGTPFEVSEVRPAS